MALAYTGTATRVDRIRKLLEIWYPRTIFRLQGEQLHV